MDHLRIEIWDHLYRSGPQTTEQIVAKLCSNAVEVNAAVDHEWFERRGELILIADQLQSSRRQSLGRGPFEGT